MNCSINENELEQFKKKNYNSTYGELTFNGVKTIIDNVISLINNNDLSKYTFYDLGCGSANTLKYACELSNFKQLIGIEFSKIRYNVATKNVKNNCNIKIINDDLLSNKIKYNKHNSIFYISNLCFSDEVNKNLGVKLSKELKNKSILFSTRLIPISLPHKLITITLEQTWTTESNTYIYIIGNLRKPNKKTRKKRLKYKKTKTKKNI